ncbi:MAG: hypothetical protein IPO42_10400 [Chitinophagaceae bacterium]|nr:hypothetical protein [Chitinophagaceae bacterium]
MSSDNFFSELLIQFPKLESEFDTEDGLHYKMNRFANYTIEQIEQKNIEELNKCFDFVESRIRLLTPDIENALNVSYCETLLCYDQPKRGIEMKNMMPKQLFRFYLDYKKYYNSLG